MKIICVLGLTILCLACGYGSSKMTPPQPGAVPVISQLVPNSAKAGDPALALTVNGSAFNQDAVVNFNGSHQTTTYMTTNLLVAMIPASAIATPGTAPDTVTNPGHAGGGGYTARAAQPRILPQR
jgi:IPT/TIG domain-containing protein